MRKKHYQLLTLLILFFAQTLFAQTINITGTITSKEDNQPLLGNSLVV